MFFTLVLFISNTFSQQFVGGASTLEADSSKALSIGVESIYLNPAGIGKVDNNRISSSASSYTYKTNKNGNEFNSNANHVGMIKSFDSFNLGFMIFSPISDITEINITRNTTNSEGFKDYYDESELQKQSLNSYYIGFSPKDSLWGISLGLSNLDIEYKSTFTKHNIFTSDYTKRKWTESKSRLKYNIRFLNLIMGTQIKVNKFNLGLTYSSPGYVVQSSGNVTSNNLQVNPLNNNENIILNINTEYESEIKNDIIFNNRLFINTSYEFRSSILSLELMIQDSGHILQWKNTKSNVDQGFWSGNTNTYTRIPTSTESGFANTYDKSQVVPAIGYKYILSENTNIGVGANYIQSTSKQSLGTNDINLTMGLSQTYDRFSSNFAFIYTRKYDSGHNIKINRDEDIELEIKDNLDEISYQFLFGGSYHF